MLNWDLVCRKPFLDAHCGQLRAVETTPMRGSIFISSGISPHRMPVYRQDIAETLRKNNVCILPLDKLLIILATCNEHLAEGDCQISYTCRSSVNACFHSKEKETPLARREELQNDLNHSRHKACLQKQLWWPTHSHTSCFIGFLSLQA